MRQDQGNVVQRPLIDLDVRLIILLFAFCLGRQTDFPKWNASPLQNFACFFDPGRVSLAPAELPASCLTLVLNVAALTNTNKLARMECVLDKAVLPTSLSWSLPCS